MLNLRFAQPLLWWTNQGSLTLPPVGLGWHEWGLCVRAYTCAGRRCWVGLSSTLASTFSPAPRRTNRIDAARSQRDTIERVVGLGRFWFGLSERCFVDIQTAGGNAVVRVCFAGRRRGSRRIRHTVRTVPRVQRRENMAAPIRINRNREVPVSFRGYRLKAGEQERPGLRATPITTLSRRSHSWRRGAAVLAELPQSHRSDE